MKRIEAASERVADLQRQARALRNASDPAITWKKQDDLERAEAALRDVLAELAELGIESKEA